MTRVRDFKIEGFNRGVNSASQRVTTPFSRTILLETRRTRRARGGSRHCRRDNSVTLRALLVSGVGTLAAPCAACYWNSGPCYSPFNSDTLQYALRYNCNPNRNSAETYENCTDDNGVHISNWDVSGVTSMNSIFTTWNGATSFNADISRWNVSSVTYMYNMFSGATSFNRDLSSWDVSSVTNMYNMFSGATSFNADLSGWDVSSVHDMSNMFSGATSFNRDLTSWNTVNVYSASNMFYGATAWLNSHAHLNDDGPPDRWCDSNCAFPADGQALKAAVAFCLNANADGNCDCSQSAINCRHGLNQPMSEWDVSQVTDMSGLFQHGRSDGYSSSYYITGINAQSFNADISRWNTHAVTSMSHMFSNAQSFNGDISRWNTQSLAFMQNMFENAKSFDVDITEWTCDAYERLRTRDNVENMFTGADAWHASYVNKHTGYFERDLGPPNMWLPSGEYDSGLVFGSDKRVRILIAFVAVLGALVVAMGIFLIVRCVTHRKRTAKKVTTQFRIAHAHNAVSQQQQNLGMIPMPPGPPMLPGRSPIVVTLPAVSPPAQQEQTEESQQV